MIDFNQVSIRTSYPGQPTVSTLDGTISIEEGRGRMVIRDSVTKGELQVHDRTGSAYKNASEVTTSKIDEFGTHYYDQNGSEMSRMDAEGTHYMDEQGRVMNRIDEQGQHIMNTDQQEVTRLDQKGITIIEGGTQRQRARFGTATDDGRTGVWVTEPGRDLSQEGI